MLAAVLTGPGRLELVERPEEPDPGPGEVLVAVRRVGICGTDYHAYDGTQNFIEYPCVLGHELAVEVLAVGRDVTRVAPGDRCAVMPYLSCGACVACRRGRSNCCERIEVLGVTRPGGLRERMLLPAAQLFPGDGLALEQLVLVETLGIGWHAVRRAAPGPDDTVLVLGAGPVGLAVAQAARRTAARVLLADPVPRRVGFAAGAGLHAFVVGGDLVARVREHAAGELPSVVFDASGNHASMERAFELVGPGGRLVFVGHTRGVVTFANPRFHASEVTLHASRNATAQDWEQVLAAVRDGSLDATAWVNHRSTLTSVVDDLPRLASSPGHVVKAVVDLGPEEERP
ncbi:zinc-binding alcohol dehydrogenase family protein [Kineosporia sp. R_H_3]|uniref:zinc-binding alcohol dehydrogenase family protein n=1 Tax=Kineosporia sp. R_H_3 TaxID=1961848 RepID=UPI000B4AD407|nr:zinc-binding alcohol dehydrogenase family protein [Kineosporia sp. R_H_3]